MSLVAQGGAGSRRCKARRDSIARLRPRRIAGATLAGADVPRSPDGPQKRSSGRSSRSLVLMACQFRLEVGPTELLRRRRDCNIFGGNAALCAQLR